MRFGRAFVAGLRRLIHRREAELEIDEELRSYLQNAAEELMRRGMSYEDAWRRARAEMGRTEAVKEQVRSAGWENLLESAWQDIRFACRQWRRNPGFTALGIGTLPLGITANSTIISWISSTLLNPIPGVVQTRDMVTILRGERSEHPAPPFFRTRIMLTCGTARAVSPASWPITTTTWRSPDPASRSESMGP